MLNFRIVENAPPSYMERYEEFIELYNDHSITVQEVSKILGWSVNVFEKAKHHALMEGRIELRKPYNRHNSKKVKKPPKYYSYSKYGKKFCVKKYIYDEERKESALIYYGSYISERVAERVVSELKKVDWDKNELDGICRKIKKEYGLEEL